MQTLVTLQTPLKLQTPSSVLALPSDHQQEENLGFKCPESAAFNL